MASCAPAASPPVGPGGEIGTGQSFSGLVNGEGDGAIIQTFCPGAMWEGRRGPVVEGQTMSVTQDPNGEGHTGDYWSVIAQPAGSGWIETFSLYDEPTEFLEGFDVPCVGKGTVVFHQCYGIIGCTSGAPDIVTVQFVNIAL